MDGRDSSTPANGEPDSQQTQAVVPPQPATGGASDNDDGGIISVTAALAKEAQLLFQARRFGECIDVLKQLLQKKEDDPKVLHNIVVSEYFRDGCSDPRKLLDVFNKVKKRSEDLGRASGEQLKLPAALEIMQFQDAKGLHLPCINSLQTMPAIILFHLHDYANALSVLETLYQKIEPIDETTALHVCLLLLDVALASHDASKAAVLPSDMHMLTPLMTDIMQDAFDDVIQYLEKAPGVGYMINQGDNGSTVQHQSTNQVPKDPAVPTNLVASDVADASANTNASENSLDRTLSDDTLEYETLLSTLDSGGQNLARPTLLSPNESTRTLAERPPAVDLKLKLQLYKVQLLLLARNLKAAKRELKLAMNIARGKDSSKALLLKSQLEYARGNHRKAIKLLMTSSNRTDAGILCMFNNNLGCIHHQLGKHHTSIMYFSKALRYSSALRSEKPLKLSTFSQDKSFLIMYNCGLQSLACGKPLLAARSFQKASTFFYNRPLLWLRFAECCLLALEKGLLRSTGASSTEEVKIHVVGAGKWRHLVVEDTLSRNRGLVSTGEDGLICNSDQYRLSVPFARQCLLNVLHLLDVFELKGSVDHIEEGSNQVASIGLTNSNHKGLPGVADLKASSQVNANGDSKETRGGSPNNIFQTSISSYEGMLRKDHHMIRQAALADLAYVELNLENPLRALLAATELQQLPGCSRIYIFLSRVYAAEALCRLNRPKEAAEHLSAYLLDGNNVELPYSDEDRDNCFSHKSGDEDSNCAVSTKESRNIMFLKPEEARGVLYVNLSTMSIMQGNLEQANRFAKEAVSVLPNNTQALLAMIYINLLQGKTQDALIMLKRCSRVRFLSSGVTLTSA
ncbi:hypothetical protein QJS10_CPA05g01388 [Acorus calamus]|uniref:CCR4-NOT transcription complex subunit 10 n=1 Tax=Acorus calamus TaxID=4465 RepID=A0AAV9EV80_ACOCL|nr:hypothetical protein QJS10_CPA05g01388 [Acorus calamus]